MEELKEEAKEQGVNLNEFELLDELNRVNISYPEQISLIRSYSQQCAKEANRDMFEALKEMYELHSRSMAAVSYPIDQEWLNAANKAKSALQKAEGKTE